MAFEIQTYWNVETLYYVFNAIAALMGEGGNFSGMLHLVFVFALGLAILGYLNRQLEVAKWFIHALIFVTVLNAPVATVAFVDKTGLEQPKTVEKVPFALAAVAHISNLVFGSLTETYETVFNVPEELGLQKGDVGFAHRILKQVNRTSVQDPELRADLMQFFKECTVYDIKDGEIGYQNIVSATDSWETIFKAANPARFVSYHTLGQAVTDTCRNVADKLAPRVTRDLQKNQDDQARFLFPRAGSQQQALELFMGATAQSYEWMLNQSANASDAMKQAMFNNLWREAGAELPALLNDPARVAEVNALMGAAQAARQADGANSTMSLLAQEVIPHMRNWIEAIVYALFPVIVLLMVASSTEGAKRIFMGYLMSLTWIGLWPLLFAVINHLSMMHLSRKLAALQLAENGVTFQVSDVFEATLIDEQAAIGYMVILVPMIAGMIVRMGQGGFAAVADRMMAPIQSAGSAAGSSLASGNLHLGQAGLDTASVNTTSMHKYDANVGLRSGMMSLGLGSGNQLSISPNGMRKSMNRMNNALGYQESEASALQAAMHENVQNNVAAGVNKQTGYRRDDSAGLTEAKGYGQTAGAMQSMGYDYIQRHGAQTGAMHVDEKAVTNSASQNANYHESGKANVNISGGVSGGAGAGVGGGGSGGAGGIPGARVGVQGSGSVGKTYLAGNSTDQTDNLTARDGQSAQKNSGYQDGFENTKRDARGFQSAQTSHDRAEAIRSGSSAFTRGVDANQRQEVSYAQGASRTRSNTWASTYDVVSDPDAMAKIARALGMSEIDLMDMPTQQQRELVRGYFAAQAGQNVNRLPEQGMGGGTLPGSAADVERMAGQFRQGISQPDLDKKHAANVAKTKYGGTEPIDAPALRHQVSDKLGQIRKDVDAQLSPSEPNGVAARAEAVRQQVGEKVDRNRSAAQGKMNPTLEATRMVGEDAVDTVQKSVDNVKNLFGGGQK